jgi:chemotaxis protein methyltransferase CheR
MTDAECVAFLRWALPRLEMEWSGFRKVRGQVCKRVERRRRELGLSDVAAYRRYLEEREDEWRVLEGLTRVTISRFYRDRGFFDALAGELLPALARASEGGELRVWSAGCASGEEPYTLALVWDLRLAREFPGVELEILATDYDGGMLSRARAGCYSPSSLKELPADLRSEGFAERDGRLCLRDEHARRVTFERHDLREAPPRGPFDLVLCRNVAFTYFAEPLRSAVAARMADALRRGGALAVGAHEDVPDGCGLEPWPGLRGVYRCVRG